MTFTSVLMPVTEGRIDSVLNQPPRHFHDLNLDQIVDAVVAGREEYDLKPFFCTPLESGESVEYRHEVFRDLEEPTLLSSLNDFARELRDMRERRAAADKMHYKESRQAWFLETVQRYCGAVRVLTDNLSRVSMKSRGLTAFRDYLIGYAQSASFRSLLSETDRVKTLLANVRYCVLIKGDSITVRKYEEEPDYSAEVEATFEKFKQGAVKDYRVKFPETGGMGHIEAKILEFVARLHPDIFFALDEFCTQNAGFLDEVIATFDREIQFYMAYIDYIAPLKRSGLRFCYPRVSRTTKEVYNRDGFDLALAHKLLGEQKPIVCNDFQLTGTERILVVSGPNQGGKTTFARTFGQLHHLASVGCPVPGSAAQLFLFDKLFTHFEREEKVENLRGKLEDDLHRIHAILNETTDKSIIIMNEIFTSTTVKDEIFLSTKIMEKMANADVLGVWVTFVDELATFSPQTVSMVSSIVPENPTQRTFKILRRPADGLAYAMAIAQKYRLTYDCIKERLSP